MFPPESPAEAWHLQPVPAQAVFYRQLRPELLQYLKKAGFPPLSPDALTGKRAVACAALPPTLTSELHSHVILGWGASNVDGALHNERVRAATRLLLSSKVLEVCANACQMCVCVCVCVCVLCCVHVSMRMIVQTILI